MKFWKLLAVSVLLAVPCVLLAWGAVAIGQSAGIAVGTSSTPGQPAQRPGAPSADSFSARTRYDGGIGAYDGMSRQMGTVDPLKDVSDLSKATAEQLQMSDAYLDGQTQILTGRYARAEDAGARAGLKDELGKTIERHFDVRHETRKREIDELEGRVRRLREHLQRRQQARQTIVEMRLKQFVSKVEGLGWDADLDGPAYGGYGPGSYGPGRYGVPGAFGPSLNRQPNGTVPPQRIPDPPKPPKNPAAEEKR